MIACAQPIPQSAPRQLIKRVMASMLPRRYFVVRGLARSSAIALTFDDGPDPTHTPRLLQVLKQFNIKATFFLIGQKVERHPNLVRLISDEGHEIGHHSFTHGEPAITSSQALLRETRETIAALESILGNRPTLFRPPHGKLRAGAMLGLMAMSQRVVLWNRDPRDYRCASSAELELSLAAMHYAPGDIILLHDRIPHTAEALKAAIPYIMERQPDLQFKTVSGLLTAHANGR